MAREYTASAGKRETDGEIQLIASFENYTQPSENETPRCVRSTVISVPR